MVVAFSGFTLFTILVDVIIFRDIVSLMLPFIVDMPRNLTYMAGVNRNRNVANLRCSYIIVHIIIVP